MREIKFRAWDSIQKCMLFGGLFSGWNGVLINDAKNNIMQFTGLKDKNRKEIYEGDIVRCNYCNKDFGVVTWIKDTARFVLRWNNPCENARHTSLGYWCQVIGSIYENPELLNDAKLGNGDLDG